MRLGQRLNQLMIALSVSSLTVQSVLAQSVVPDASGPSVVSAPNGVSVVDINTPNADGVSHNTYSEFGVGADGLILNNIADNFGSTQLSGVIIGNANLAEGAASLILNEVTGTSPSLLSGFLEVAGTRADVIVANPYGISCDGCGFINTDRMTLTTGRPQFEDGAFTGLSVDGGSVGIGAGGVNALDTTRFDILSRQITVAGSIHGQRVRLVAGRNDVVYATGEVSAKASDGSDAPELAIDSTVLGGMYAGAITVVSTEDGAGVKAPGTMAASSGEMHITADGRLVMGRASSSGAARITAREIEIEESLASNAEVTLSAEENLILAADAQLVAASAMDLSAGAQAQLSQGSAVVAGGPLSLHAGAGLDLGAGARLLSQSDLSVNTPELTSDSGAVVAAGVANADGSAVAPAALSLSADEIRLTDTTVASNDRFEVSTRILEIAAEGGLPASRFVAEGDMEVTATEIAAQQAEVVSGGALQVQGQPEAALTLEGGIWQAAGALQVTAGALNVDATLQSLSDRVSLSATGGDLTLSGIVAGEAVSLSAEASLQNAAQVQGAQGVALNAGTLTNSGTIQALSGAVQAEAAEMTNSGALHGATAVQLELSEALTNSGAVTSDGWIVIAGPEDGTEPAIQNIAGGEIIAASDLVLEASALENAGVLAASEGRLLLQVSGDLSNAASGVLFGKTLTQILSDGSVVNDGGVILAQEDFVLAGLSGASAQRFTNQSGGHVETFDGDIRIAATTIENLRDVTFGTDTVTTVEQVKVGDCSGDDQDCTTTTTTTEVITQTVDAVGSAASMLISGGDMLLLGETAENRYSLISAQGDIALDLDQLVNEGRDLIETTNVSREIHYKLRRCYLWCSTKEEWRRTEIEDPVAVPVDAMFATIEAGGTITGSISGYVINGAVAEGDTIGDSGTLAPGLISSGPDAMSLTALSGDVSGLDAGALSNSGLIVQITDPDAAYLLETRYEFVDLEQFLSSDYFLGEIGYDPDRLQKRIGDSYVETQLIREQIFALTGQRLLGDTLDERAQIKAMYDHAIDAAQALDLIVGVALTPAQIAALTEDIIWLEEVVVNGQTVLAPRVYLASASSLEARGRGAQIQAADLTLIAGEFVNSGSVSSRTDLRLAVTGDLLNLGGDLLAEAGLQIEVAGLLRSISGEIRGEDVRLAANDIVIETGVLTQGSGDNYQQGAARSSTVMAGNTLVLQATNDLSLSGATLASGGDAALIAGGSVTVGALALQGETDTRFSGGYSVSDSLTHLTSRIDAGGDLVIQSLGTTGDVENVVFEGAQVTAAGTLGIAANAGDVILGAVADSAASDIKYSHSGFLSKSSGRIQSFDVTHQLTELSGAEISVNAAGGILAEGTRFLVGTEAAGAVSGQVATQTANLTLNAAGGDLVFTAPTDIHARSEYHKSSSLGGLIGSSSDIRTLSTDALGSVARVEGDMRLRSGGDLTLTAVDFQVGGAFTTEVAGETTLLAAIDTDYAARDTMRNNGITITTVTASDYTEQVTFNAIDAASVDFDAGSAVTLAGVRDALVGSSHAGSWTGAGGSDLAIAAAWKGQTDPTTGPPETSPDSTAGEDWRADLSMVSVALPTGEDGNGYLYLDGLVARDGTTVEAITLIDDHFYDKTTVLNPAFKALLTIVVTQGIGGLGLGAAVTENAILQGAIETFASNMTVGVIEGGITGNFDLDEVVKSAALSAASAGIGAKLTGAINIEGLDTATIKTIGDQSTSLSGLVNGVLDTAITTGVNSALYGTDFAEAFTAALLKDAVETAMAGGQNIIGDTFDEGSLASILTHGLVGCAAADVLGADCAAGATAGMAQSIFSGWQDRPVQQAGESGEAYAARVDAWKADVANDAELIGASAGYLFSGSEAENVYTAAQVAKSGTLNNYLAHEEIDEFDRRLKECGYDDDCIEQTVTLFMKKSAINDDRLASCSTQECVAEHRALIEEAAERYAQFQNEYGDILAVYDPHYSLYNSQETAEYLASLTSTRIGEQIADGQGLSGSAEDIWKAGNCAGLSFAICEALYVQHLDQVEEEAKQRAIGTLLGAGILAGAAVAPEAAAACMASATCVVAWQTVEAVDNVATLAQCASGDAWACGEAAINAVTPGNFADDVSDAARIGDKAAEGAGAAKGATNSAGDLPTVTQNRIRHNQAVEDANAQFNASGLTTRTEVTLESCTGTRCRADTVIQGEAGQTSTSVPEGFTAYDLDGNQLDSIPLGSNGQGIAIVETKTGNATLSGNQSVGYPEVSQGTVSGVGNNANSANLAGAVPADTPVVILTPE